MRTELLAAALAALLSACSTPASRIRAHQAEFDSYPRAVQDKIRAGEVDVGFTPRQVTLSLGRPRRTYRRRSAGSAQEVWAYGGGPSRTSFGVGFGTGTMGPGYGGALGLGLEDGPEEDRLRVVFEGGAVVAVVERTSP